MLVTMKRLIATALICLTLCYAMASTFRASGNELGITRWYSVKMFDGSGKQVGQWVVSSVELCNGGLRLFVNGKEVMFRGDYLVEQFDPAPERK